MEHNRYSCVYALPCFPGEPVSEGAMISKNDRLVPRNLATNCVEVIDSSLEGWAAAKRTSALGPMAVSRRSSARDLALTPKSSISMARGRRSNATNSIESGGCHT